MIITLEKLLYNLTELAIQENIVNFACAGASFSSINPLTIKDYPMLFIQPQGQHRLEDNYTVYSLNFYYIDRLLNDDSNSIAIYSTSIEELKNLLNKIKNEPYFIDYEGSTYFENFTETEAKADRCAGCVARVKIKIANISLCHE